MNNETQKITILFLIDFLASRDGITGGTERQLIDLINCIDTKKFRPIIVCLQQFSPVTMWEKILCEKKILHVYSLSSWCGIKAFYSFIKYLKENSVSVVQTFFFDSTMFGVFAARFAGINNIISSRRDLGFWYTNKILKKLRFANFFTKHILVNSEAIKRYVADAEKAPVKKIKVLTNGIDIKNFDKIIPVNLTAQYKQIIASDIIVGYVGNFNRKVKRADLFIEAAAQVIKKTHNVKFVIVGGGSQEHILKKKCHDLLLDDHVIFTGKQANAVSLIKSFDIGVLTSDSEGFPNVILEYMAASIPCVATSVGGNIELIEDGFTGYLVPHGSAHAIAASICRLINDQFVRLEMGKNARIVAENKYAWDVKIREFELFYSSMCK